MIDSIYFKHRSFHILLMYGLYLLYLWFGSVWIVDFIIPLLIGGIFLVSVIDSVISIVVLLGVVSNVTVNKIIGTELWTIKYKPETSFVYGLSKYAMLDYVIWVPFAVLVYSSEMQLTAYTVIIATILLNISALLIDTLQKNAGDYFHE